MIKTYDRILSPEDDSPEGIVFRVLIPSLRRINEGPVSILHFRDYDNRETFSPSDFASKVIPAIYASPRSDFLHRLNYFAVYVDSRLP